MLVIMMHIKLRNIQIVEGVFSIMIVMMIKRL